MWQSLRRAWRRLWRRWCKRPRPTKPMVARLQPEVRAREERAYPGQMWDLMLHAAVDGRGWSVLGYSLADAGLAGPLPPLPRDEGGGGWTAWLLQNSAPVPPPPDL